MIPLLPNMDNDPANRTWLRPPVTKAFNPGQPRDARGRWADASGGMAAYVDMVATHFPNQRVMGYLKEHAQAFPTDDKSFVGGKPQRCYENAAKAVLADPDLTYVEGYVSVHGVPIAHAWTVNKEGVVRDVTLKSGDAVRGYYGVPIQTRFLTDTLVESGHYGILTGDERGQGAARVLAADPSEVIAR